jgi:hypothetical protein
LVYGATLEVRTLQEEIKRGNLLFLMSKFVLIMKYRRRDSGTGTRSHEDVVVTVVAIFEVYCSSQ